MKGAKVRSRFYPFEGVNIRLVRPSETLSVSLALTNGVPLFRLLHLAIIHEAKDYSRTMIDLSRNTDFLNRQNYQRQVRESLFVKKNKK